MQYFRLIAFLLALASFGMLAAFGQTPGTPAPQAPTAAQPPTAQTPQPNPSPNMQAPAAPDLKRRWRPIKVKLVTGRRLQLIKQLPDQPLDPQIDQGIFLRAAGNMCGSIVSYNFSRGDNPELQSVTTCTPSDAVRTLRTRDQDQKPQAPLLQKTTYSPGPKQ
jgi:hypothetical protein